MALPKRTPQASNPPNGTPKGQSNTGGTSGPIADRPLPTEPDGRDLIQVENPLGTPGPDEIQR